MCKSCSLEKCWKNLEKEYLQKFALIIQSRTSHLKFSVSIAGACTNKKCGLKRPDEKSMAREPRKSMSYCISRIGEVAAGSLPYLSTPAHCANPRWIPLHLEKPGIALTPLPRCIQPRLDRGFPVPQPPGITPAQRLSLWIVGRNWVFA